MPLFRPDPTFYPSPRMAMKAPRERLAYVAAMNPKAALGEDDTRPDALLVVDVDLRSPDYGKVINKVDLPYAGDELHHFGWNACSSALCPSSPHPHVERRYLIVPGLRSSRLYILDTKPDPVSPKIVKVIEPEEVKERAGYSRLHTVHCGPDNIYLSALGSADGDLPGGLLLLDHDDFEVLGRWEVDRGPQRLAYDFWWHIAHDIGVTSEWGAPQHIEKGVDLDALMAQQYGRRLHFWDLRRRKHLQAVDLGDGWQMVLELRPAHDPTKTYGFVYAVLNLQDLSSGIFLWYRENGTWRVREIIRIPAEPAEEDQLPPALKPFKAVPPLVTDINLSLDDRFLYVSCWGTGELRQYDVSEPFNPKLTGSVRLGGIVARAPHPKVGPVNGGPQMVEVSRDGRRVYFTNSLYAAWDAIFYPDGIKGWIALAHADPEGGLTLDPDFFPELPDYLRPHQVRLEGGDSSSDSFCFP